jgi:hypothetical protein
MKAPLLVISLACSMLCLSDTAVFGADSESLDEILDKVIKAYEKIDDYTCRFSQKELANGTIREDKNLVLKFRKPQHIYLRWTEGKIKELSQFISKEKTKTSWLFI